MWLSDDPAAIRCCSVLWRLITADLVVDDRAVDDHRVRVAGAAVDAGVRYRVEAGEVGQRAAVEEADRRVVTSRQGRRHPILVAVEADADLELAGLVEEVRRPASHRVDRAGLLLRQEGAVRTDRELIDQLAPLLWVAEHRERAAVIGARRVGQLGREAVGLAGQIDRPAAGQLLGASQPVGADVGDPIVVLVDLRADHAVDVLALERWVEAGVEPQLVADDRTAQLGAGVADVARLYSNAVEITIGLLE